MIGLLRVVRGFCGFVFVLQAVQIIQALGWLSAPETASVDAGKFFALVLFKVIVLAIAAALFFWLRGVINNLHVKKTGAPHPALAEKKWAL